MLIGTVPLQVDPEPEITEVGPLITKLAKERTLELFGHAA
jgi:hypothetical protein